MRTASLTCIVVCLFLTAVVTLLPSLLRGQDSSGKITQTPAAVRTGVRALRIAVVQMQSSDHDIDGNLKRASTFAETAAAKGAQFVIFPICTSTLGTRASLPRVRQYGG